MMEFVGYDESIRVERLRLLTDAASEFIHGLQFDDTWPERWFGWRPMTYDSTPIIGKCPGFSNLYLAAGHNMLGLSMAPATGKLIAELVAGQETHLRSLPYAVERFR